jgi:hypothetical protein
MFELFEEREHFEKVLRHVQVEIFKGEFFCLKKAFLLMHF